MPLVLLRHALERSSRGQCAVAQAATTEVRRRLAAAAEFSARPNAIGGEVCKVNGAESIVRADGEAEAGGERAARSTRASLDEGRADGAQELACEVGSAEGRGARRRGRQDGVDGEVAAASGLSNDIEGPSMQEAAVAAARLALAAGRLTVR